MKRMLRRKVWWVLASIGLCSTDATISWADSPDCAIAARMRAEGQFQKAEFFARRCVARREMSAPRPAQLPAPPSRPINPAAAPAPASTVARAPVATAAGQWTPPPFAPIVFDPPVACPAVPPKSTQAAAKGPEVAGIRLGMTVDEVVAACCAIPSMKARVRRVAIDKTGHQVSLQTDPKQLVEPPFLSSVACGGSAGMIDVGFSPPPSTPRVVRIHDKAFGEVLHTTPDKYLHDLVARYGNPVDHGATEPIDPARGSSAVTYKWLFRKSATEQDCAPRAASGDTFDPTLPATGQCATHVVVRIAGDPNHVIAADFELNNLREFAGSYDQHIHFLNQKYGTKLPEGTMTAGLSQRLPSTRSSSSGQAATTDSTNDALLAAFVVLMGVAIAGQASSGGGSAFTAGQSHTFQPPAPIQGETMAETHQRIVQECRQNCQSRKVFCVMGSGQEGYDAYQECQRNSDNNISLCENGCE